MASITAHIDIQVFAANIMFYILILPVSVYAIYKAVQTLVNDFRYKEGLFAKDDVEGDWL
jgi:hypothetical protein